MSARPTCDECGTALPANALQGLCPQYLVAMGLNLAAATEQARCKPPYLTEALEDSSLPLLNAKRKSPRSRDLEMICLKCLNKDPQRLHRSAKIFSKTRGLRHVSTLTVNKTTKGSRKNPMRNPLCNIMALCLSTAITIAISVRLNKVRTDAGPNRHPTARIGANPVLLAADHGGRLRSPLSVSTSPADDFQPARDSEPGVPIEPERSHDGAVAAFNHWIEEYLATSSGQEREAMECA